MCAHKHTRQTQTEMLTKCLVNQGVDHPHLNVFVLVEGATGAEELAELTARHQGHQQVGSSWGQHQSNIITDALHHAASHHGGYSKTRYKKLFTHVESHASAVSLPESGE